VRKDRYYSGLIKYMVLFGDTLLVVMSFEISAGIMELFQIHFDYQSIFFVIFILTWLISGLLNKIYKINEFSSTREIAVNLTQTFIIHLLIMVSIVATLLPPIATFNYLFFNHLIMINLVIWSRVIFKLLFKYYEFSGFDLRRVIIVGTTEEGKNLYDFFDKHKGSGYHFLGFFDDSKRTDVPASLIKGRIEDLEKYCLDNDVEEIYFALNLSNENLIINMRKFCDDQVIYFRIAPDFSEILHANYNVFLYDTLPIIAERREPLGLTLNLLIKRAFDIVFSLLVILFIFPFIFPVIALAIKINSPGPILFKQLRPGKRNRLFECYKFRTMRLNKQSELQATKNDPRVTRVGKILRKTNLDELPQFFNVLLGSMSVVGPRPNMIGQLDHYSKIINKYKLRHFITPGITGYAQVNGFRGETKDDRLMAKRVEYDVEYIENWSFALDLKIIFLTVYNMIKGEKEAY
jgi:putative colanic acid biosysnthesis UDP-glucose lipid carrier transferase